ncbi:MAG: NAD-dependent epimerase/dehydratase family protein [Ignavibacteria bacterium]|nr:NAD-dependent epimerase/dehydratase family protein [Ignavibacteria bacterium]
MSKENCIIYGGGGFIGSHLAEELLERGYNVTIFDKIKFSRENIESFIGKVRIIEGDFNNEHDLLSSLGNMDYVYHLVSSTLPASSNDNPVYDVESNLLSTLKLLQDIVKRKIRKIVFLSSGGTVYGVPEKIPVNENHPRRPLCSYGITKKVIEDYLYLFSYLHGLNYNVFRLSNPYGERQNPMYAQGVIPVFIKKLILGEEISVWGDGSVTRDYIYIKDAVKPLADSLRYTGNRKIFNLGSGKGISVNEITGIIQEVTGKKFKIKYLPGRNFDVPVNVLDIGLVKKEFGFEPSVNIADGVRKTYEYLQKYFN